MSNSLFDIFVKTLGGGKNAGSDSEVRTDVLKIRGKTILVENKILQISNISAVEIVTFARLFPMLSILGLLVGAGLFLMGGIGAITGLALVAWSAYAIYQYWQKRFTYGLSIQLNAGPSASVVLLCDDRSVLMNAAVTLYEIMNDPGEPNRTIYMDNRISNTITNTLTIGGDVSGTITNNVA